ncbi:energy transducer TonB [Dankookia sp. GCM10030260]|uniref:energy transducer TonB n=1 Tax=Dankookia sp. GCM10030260 TaxID=3273390 RepID=UPI00362115A1
MTQRRATRSKRPLGAGLAGSVVLHAAAGALTFAALAWRTTPAPPGAGPVVQMLWLPPAATAEAEAPAAARPGISADIAPLGPAADGIEPEDALATQVGAPAMPAAPAPTPIGLPPLPIPEMEAAELPADPTALFAAPTQTASLAVPHPAPAAAQAAALPLPPPLPPAPPRAAARAPVPAAAQQAAIAMPAPAVEPTAIPVLSGAPRFRRPPAPPPYPDRARDAGIEGTALLRLRVTADGTTQEIRLLRSAGNRLLDEAAQAAARRWEIAPALQGGRAIEAWVEVPVRFRLDE